MCWYCGSPITDEEPIGRSLRCNNCGKDLRACKNCRFYLSGARGDCRESSAEPQADKERANFCDWFSLDKKYRLQSAGQLDQQKKSNASRAAFDNLFN
ncbi:MAG: hypothetical protein LBI04_00535 [Treponema sp.]|jgi:hypothetical protein|nr:hypothetical protein [Treponema sp.]